MLDFRAESLHHRAVPGFHGCRAILGVNPFGPGTATQFVERSAEELERARGYIVYVAGDVGPPDQLWKGAGQYLETSIALETGKFLCRDIDTGT